MLQSRLASTAVALSLAAAAAACGETSTTQLTGPTDASCAVSANAPLQPLSAQGDRVTVSAAASRDCLWTASSQSSWLQVSPANGQGDGTLTVVAAANGSSDLRIGAILINNVRLTLTQGAPPAAAPSTPAPSPQPSPSPAPEPPAAPTPTPAPAPSPLPAPAPTCSFDVTPRSATFGGEGGAAAIAVSAPSGCGWTATASGGWIDITSSTRGSGSGLVLYEVNGQKGKATRNGSIIVAGVTVTITQVGDK